MVIEDAARDIALERDKLMEEYDELASWTLYQEIPRVMRYYVPELPVSGAGYVPIMTCINICRDENKDKRRELKEHCFSLIWWITCILLHIEGPLLVPKANLRVVRLVHTKLGGLFA